MIRRNAPAALLAMILLGSAGCGGENPPAGSLSIPRNGAPEGAAEGTAPAPGTPAEGGGMPGGGRLTPD